MNKTEIYKKLTNDILGILEKGNLPSWRSNCSCGLPHNHFTGHIYQGLNFLFLTLNPQLSTSYFTFLQAKQNNLKIKKGSKGNLIIFYKLINKIDSDDVFPYMKFSYVFNLSALEDFEEKKLTLEQPQNFLNKIFENHIINFEKNAAAKPCYIPALDLVSVPTLQEYNNEEGYFCSVFHELIHWTGARNRLNRFDTVSDDFKIYAFEELVAELGASFLCGLCGINNINDISCYLDGWIKNASLDFSFIPRASILAQKAVNFLLGDFNNVEI